MLQFDENCVSLPQLYCFFLIFQLVSFDVQQQENKPINQSGLDLMCLCGYWEQDVYGEKEG